jgi:hypothetical protein
LLSFLYRNLRRGKKARSTDFVCAAFSWLDFLFFLACFGGFLEANYENYWNFWWDFKLFWIDFWFLEILN